MSIANAKTMADLLKEFNSSKDLNDELEISVGFHTETGHIAFKLIYEKLFNHYKNKSKGIEIIQHLDVYYSNGVRKTLIFVKGINQKKDVYIKKKNSGFVFIKKSIKNVKNIKLKLSKENIVSNGLMEINGHDIVLMRFKLRVRFDMGKYYTDLDLIKSLEKNVLETTSVKTVKDSVFKEYEISNILNGIEYSLFNEIKLEFEFKNEERDLSLEDVFQPVNELSNIYNTDIDAYQKHIFFLAKYIISNKNYLENFRFKSGLKKLLNNVIEIDADTYYKKVQSNIVNNFYITDKIDGKRCIVILKEYKESNGMVGDKWQIILLSNDLKTFFGGNQNKSNAKKGERVEFITTILDCEMLVKEDKIELFAFDLISIKNTKLANLNFSKRYEHLGEAVSHVNKYTSDNIRLYEKKHILLTEDWKTQLTNFYNKERNYDIDGIIFTPNDESDYSKMVGYKWKPAEHSTIDFYVKKVSDEIKDFKPFNSIKKREEDDIYVLFSGVSKRDYDKFNMSLIPSYSMIFNIKKGDIGNIWKNNIIPIQFSTSDRPGNYIFVGKGLDLDNKIGEFGWNHLDEKWELKRIRTDRDVELARGEYYGNYFKVAESIWFSIMNPLTFENLLEENKGYFAEDNNNLYKEQRNYNSFVKTILLNTVVEEIKKAENNLFVIDLASGKGQDMAKLSNMKINHTLFVDNDKNAISELMKRKHGLRTEHNMKISIAHADLSLDYKNTLKSITNSLDEEPKEKADMVIMNFAIHYFTETQDSIINLINLINSVLKKGGRFVFTCFDGESINKLCGDDGWDVVENDILKYSIRKVNKDKVKLILPFSKGEYYEEYLVNLNKLNKIFEDNGFSKEIQNSFSSLFEDYNKIENLSDEDKIFVGLYSYSIYRKNIGGSVVWKPSSFIENKLGKKAAITGAADDKEYHIEVLDNVPSTNKLIIILNSDKIKQNKINYMKELFSEWGYKDLSLNPRLRKKVFVVANNEYLSKKHTDAKSTSNTSVVMIKEEFIESMEDYIKIIFKTPIMDIVIQNKCIIMSLDNYNKKKQFETSEFEDMFYVENENNIIRIN